MQCLKATLSLYCPFRIVLVAYSNISEKIELADESKLETKNIRWLICRRKSWKYYFKKLRAENRKLIFLPPFEDHLSGRAVRDTWRRKLEGDVVTIYRENYRHSLCSSSVIWNSWDSVKKVSQFWSLFGVI
jgi:hypothetical protein